MASYRITWATRERTISCCVCKVEFDAPKGPVLQRCRDDSVEEVCQTCGTALAPGLASLVPATLPVDAVARAGWLARTFVDDDWSKLAQRLVSGRHAEITKVVETLRKSSNLPVLAASLPVAVAHELSTRGRLLYGPELQRRLRAVLKRCRSEAHEQQAPHLLNAALVLAELGQALADTNTTATEDGLRRIAALAAVARGSQREDLELLKKVLSRMARTVEKTFKGLLGEIAEDPTEETIAQPPSKVEKDWDDRAPRAFAGPLWAPLVALAVHVSAPWWLPAARLPEAVDRLTVLYGEKLLHEEVRSFVARKGKHLARARKYRAQPKLLGSGKGTWKDRLTWARNCGRKIVKALVKESLWALGVPWELTQELLVAIRKEGGRQAEKVLGSSSEDDDRSGDEDIPALKDRSVKLFNHAAIRKKVQECFEERGFVDGPPCDWRVLGS